MSTVDDILADELDPEDLDPTPRGGTTGRNTETTEDRAMTAAEKPLNVRQAEGLRALADMIEQHPDAAKYAHYLSDINVFHTADPAGLETILRAGLRSGAKIEKDWTTETVFELKLAWGPIVASVLSPRDAVCERVVTGTETVTKTVPDPDALAAVPTVEVTEEVETYEWRCSPLLATEQAPAATP